MIDEQEFSAICELASEKMEHSGVKGMKWGVRNAETLKRYARAAGRVVTAPAKAAGGKIGEAMEASKAKKQAAKVHKAELRAQRRELGMTRKEYNKLRETTLKSHDPKVVAKGMRTLTDDELQAKIKRLQDEDKIAKLATDQAQNKHKVASARNEALNKNPLVQVGKGAAQTFANKTLNELGYNTLVMKGWKPRLETRVKYNTAQDLLSYSRSHPGSDQDFNITKKDSGAKNKPNISELTRSTRNLENASNKYSKLSGTAPSKLENASNKYSKLSGTAPSKSGGSMSAKQQVKELSKLVPSESTVGEGRKIITGIDETGRYIGRYRRTDTSKRMMG